MQQPENVSPEANTRKENSRKSKKDKSQGGDKSKGKGGDIAGSEMTKLDDLPSLGMGLGGKQAKIGSGFDKDDSGGFDDFDLEEDRFGDSSNKFDDAEKHL